jgi:DNA-binding MarR family transcriptional regulator
VLRLTARGLELVTTIRQALEALDAAVRSELGPNRYATFRRGLHSLLEAAANWPELDAIGGS